MKANLRLNVLWKTREGGNFADDPAELWEVLCVEWFKLAPLSAREYVQAQQVQSGISHKAECPWFAGYNTTTDGMPRGTALRLANSDESRRFNVASVVNRDEGNRTLDWMLEEVNG